LWQNSFVLQVHFSNVIEVVNAKALNFKTTLSHVAFSATRIFTMGARGYAIPSQKYLAVNL
jgi:hypothetical protein